MTRGKIFGVVAALLLTTLALLTPAAPASAVTGAVDAKLGSATLVSVAGGGASAVYGARSLQCGGSACYHLVEVLAPSTNTTSGQTTDLATLASVPQQVVVSTSGPTTTVVVAETLGVEVFSVTNSVATCKSIVLTSLTAATTAGATCTGSSAPTPAALLSSSPVVAVAVGGSTFYALHSDGTIDSSNANVVPAAVSAVVPAANAIANYSGGSAGFVLSGTHLYAARTVPSGTLSSATGDIVQIPTSGGTAVHINLGGNQPTALTTGGGYIFAAGSQGITPIDVSSPPASDIDATGDVVVYPSNTISCSTLSYTTATGGPFLYCNPSSTTDKHVYRFDASAPVPNPSPSSNCTSVPPDPDCVSSLTHVGGAPTTNRPVAVIAAPWGAYLLSAGAFSSVDNASISTILQSGSLPQPPLNVRSYARVNDQGEAIVLVVWDTPASDHTITGFYSVATGGGVTSQCGTPSVNSAGDDYCVVSGVTPGTAYTATVQSRNAAGLSAPVAAPSVNAGSPLPPGVNILGSSDPGDPGTIAHPSTFVILSPTSVKVTWPLFDSSVSSTNGVNPISSYIATAVDTASTTGAGKTCTWLSTTGTTIPGNPSMASCTITGLPAGKTTRVQVAANNTPGSAGVPPNAKWTGAPVIATPDLTALDANGNLAMVCADNGPIASTYVPGVLDTHDISTCGYEQQVDPTFIAGVAPGPKPSSITADVFATSAGVSAGWCGSSSAAVTSTGVASGAILVGWCPKSNYPALSVTGFQANAYYFDATGKQVTKSCTATGNQLPQGVGELSCVITGLINGNHYYVTVQAKTTVLGPASQYIEASAIPANTITPHGPPGAPSKPVITVPPLSTTDKVGMKANIAWTSPTDGGGAAITGYLVTATKSPVPAIPEDPLYCVDGTIAPALLTSVLSNPPSPLPSDPGTPVPPATTPPIDNSCQITGMTSQTAWTVTIRAFNQYGAGTLSGASSKFTPNGAPQPPSKVTVKALPDNTAVNEPGTLSVSWTAPTFQGGAPISSYDVTVWKPGVVDPGGTIHPPTTQAGWTCSTTTTSCNVANIPTGYGYYATVVAYNQVAIVPPGPTGAQHASDASAASPTVQMYGRPNLVTVDAAVPSDRTITVTWETLVTNDTQASDPTFGEGPITGYVLSATAGSTVKSATITANPVPCIPAIPGETCQTASITGLTNGTNYSVSVAAQNAGSTGFPGLYLSGDAVTPGTAPTAPATVNVRSYSTGADVWWTHPTSTGGVPITGYTVTAVPGGASCTVADDVTAGCSLSGLTNGITYTVTVRATNQFGTSPDSKPSAAFTPVGLPSQPSNVKAYPSPKGSVATITWAPPNDAGGGSIEGYTVTAKPVTPGTGTVVTCKSTGTAAVPAKGSTPAIPAVPAPATCDVTGLTNGAAYTVAVTATNQAGDSAPSAPSQVFTPVGPPTPPRGVFAYTDIGRDQTTGNGTLHVTWQAPDNNGGFAITKFIATASPGGLWCEIDDENGTGCDIAGLTTGAAYTVTVTAWNLDGESDPSTASPIAHPAGVPSAPKSVAVAAGQNSATVTWQRAAANGAPIKQYYVHVMPGNRVVVVASTATSAVIQGLTPGRAYRFQVQANNVVGTSGLSKASKTVKPLRTPGRVAKPKATVHKVGTRSTVTLRWVKVATHGGAPVLRYVIARQGGGSKRVGPHTTTVSFTGLRPGKYVFTVRAVNRNGAGPVSQRVTVTVR